MWAAAAIILMSWLVFLLLVMCTLNLTVNFLFASVFLSLWPRVFPFLTSQDPLLQSYDPNFLLENCVSAVIARSNLTSQQWGTAEKTEWHPIFLMLIHTTPSDDVPLMPFPVGLNCVQAPENIIQSLLCCQSTRRGLNPGLNCAHFTDQSRD